MKWKFVHSSESDYELTKTVHGQELISWQGRTLCSSRDPLREGEKWASLVQAKFGGKVVILGLGLGYHVQALASLRPDLLIHVFDLHETLLQRFESPRQVILHKSSSPMYLKFDEVYDFQPAQQGLEKEYQLLKQNLFGVETEVLLEKKNIKQICALYPEVNTREAKLWMALKEIVR